MISPLACSPGPWLGVRQVRAQCRTSL